MMMLGSETARLYSGIRILTAAQLPELSLREVKTESRAGEWNTFTYL
jgi:hypothetical protein